jgi:serine/threonine-protein kinase RsbT
MVVKKSERMPLLLEEDMVKMRHLVRKACSEIGFSLVESTKIITAASELGRNTLYHGSGGEMLLEILDNGGRIGIRMAFEDKGKGIPDLELALKDGYTTGTGMGLGLSGSKRLMNEFSVTSRVGEGTKVVVARWKMGR